MKKLLSLLLTLAWATSAFAECAFYMDDFVVKGDQIGHNTEITLPIKATFSGRLNGWDLLISYPEHLIPTYIEPGADMTLTYYDARGKQKTLDAPLSGAYEPWDHLLCAIATEGYYQDPDGENPSAWVTHNTVKWEAGEYEEMLLLSFIVEEGFEGGEIVLKTCCASGRDPRGGTILENGDYKQWFERTCSVDIDGNIFEVDNIRYRATSDTTACVIRKNEIEYGYSGVVIIPEKVTYKGQTYAVTSIGFSAFKNCSGLTSVTIPNSITFIAENAFSNCSGLTRINIFDLSAWCGIVFYNADSNPLSCAHHLYLNGEEIKDLFIPNSIKSINDNAFYSCTGLTSVTIPESVKVIGESAFSYCSGLTNIVIHSAVTIIRNYAFYDCSGLKQIYCFAIVPPVTESNTFYNCYGATLYVPIEVVDTYKAANYWKKFAVIIGMSVDFEVDGICYRTTSDNTVVVRANEEVENYYTGKVVIPETVTYEDTTYTVIGIRENAFDGCQDLSGVVIPKTVTRIGKQAFQGCVGLTSVTIGEGLNFIGAQAFNYCYALAMVTCKGIEPPVMESSNCFMNSTYSNATLRVLRDAQVTYSTANYWFKFEKIEGFGSSGPGDVDGDGKVSIADVTAMTDYILGSNSDEEFYLESGDLNGNGRIDIGDVTTILDSLLNNN